MDPVSTAAASNAVNIKDSANITLNNIYDAHMHHSEHLENLEIKLNVAILALIALAAFGVIFVVIRKCKNYKIVKQPELA